MPNLRDQIHSLANDFAANLVKAFHSASFSDIAALSTTSSPSPGSSAARSPSPKRKRVRAAKKPAPPGAAKPPATVPANRNPDAAKAPKKPFMRRGPEEIAKIVVRIVDVVAKSPTGMRAEDIGKALGLKSNELPRPLKEGVAAKKLSKKGVKRATTYFVTRK
jgi:hypothetical protein